MQNAIKPERASDAAKMPLKKTSTTNNQNNTGRNKFENQTKPLGVVVGPFFVGAAALGFVLVGFALLMIEVIFPHIFLSDRGSSNSTAIATITCITSSIGCGILRAIADNIKED